ncbi:MAG TPA: hypothetical protein VHM31_16410 [Polyangia bacterium]|nr:hypothetical protein [Polyangia bacterium]
MAMNLKVYWHPPVRLVDGRKDNLIYSCDWERIPEGPGVYMFGRLFAGSFAPLYIGKSKGVAGRIWQHLAGNIPLMMKLKNGAKNGQRVVVAGEWQSSRGQNARKALGLIESALIKHSLLQGHDIFNDKMTKTVSNTITRTGHTAHGFLPKHMKIEVR